MGGMMAEHDPSGHLIFLNGTVRYLQVRGNSGDDEAEATGGMCVSRLFNSYGASPDI